MNTPKAAPVAVEARDPQMLTRAEWERRYAAHLMSRGDVPEIPAIQMAQAAAAENFRNNGDEWLDPEDDADVEMSYWENDGE